MSNKMLIDATHPEETRVVVLRGNRVEEFDFEAADRQQLRGNIYLAKVTRVEPSLQAAFVDYGGNRHGFLAFSEIHPDYYQIPFADRQALLQEQAREEAEDAEQEAEQDRAAEDAAPTGESDGDLEAKDADEDHGEERNGAGSSEENGDTEHDDTVESVGAEDALEELPERRKPRPRQYKIQEVIKRRQVLLVQVVKEERGNKGAALTTYLSLAGRYSVLMPNTGRGGGISRKITNPADRKRLKAIAGELEVPEGMGIILRTAGANRTKTEVKRDFEYLLRLWENVRELTLRSSAPKLVYEEGSLIKRSIRDLYSREIEQIVVAGEDAYREAKDFMRMLMPSHARNVQLYRDDTPIFSRNGVEAQLDAMFSPQVTLRSGGYIVINQTEALVAIDVNSGRSTREHSIEDTALNTNLEAAEEVARQLRLRDLAGLIVIDFIDMEENRNNKSVERKLKDCLRADRARIQLGRISHFGLMEMSRQRIRTGVLESSTVLCPHCHGIGQVRSISSLSLQILRGLEDYLLRHSNHHLYVHTRPDVALYVLNQKRRHLAQLEARFGLTITIVAETPHDGSGFSVERGALVEERPERTTAIAMLDFADNSMPADLEAESEPEADVEPEPDMEAEAKSDTGPDEGRTGGEGRERGRRRRRRTRGKGEDRHERDEAHVASGVEQVEAREPDAEASDGLDTAEAEGRGGSSEDENGQDARRRRRGRRGGRRRGRGRENGDHESANGDAAQADASDQTREDDRSDAAFAPGDPSEQEAKQFATASSDDWQDRPQDGLGLQAAAAEAFRGSNEPPALAEAASEQVSGIFGSDDARPDDTSDGTRGDGHAEEVSALTKAVQHDEEMSPPSQDAAAEPEPQRERELVSSEAPEPVEDNRPKRSGWWNRRSFF